MSDHETLHATTVAIDGRAVLLMGPSGSGKSDLALRLMDRGAALVSDDYTVVTRVGGLLLASPPDRLAGKIEVRGIGIVAVEHCPSAPVSLILNLGSVPDRMPDQPKAAEIAGLLIPALPFAPLEASAPIKVALALEAFGLATGSHGNTAPP